MKKLLAALLAVCLLLSVCGCSKDNSKQSKSSVVGTISGENYQNSFTGLNFTLPDGWAFSTEEEIRELNQATADMAGEDYVKLMEQTDSFYDMMAVSASGVENVNVTMEKIPAGYEKVSIREIQEEGIPMMEEILQNMGAQDIECVFGTAMFNGEKTEVLYISSDFSFTMMYQLSHTFVSNGYLVSISITATEEDVLRDVLSQFSLDK